MIIDAAHWSAKPFIRILIPTIIGILTYEWVGIRTCYSWIALFILLLGLYHCIRIRLSFENAVYYGVLGQLIYVIVGYSVASFQDQRKNDDHFLNYTIVEEPSMVYGLVEQVKKRKSRYEAVVNIRQIVRDDSLVEVSGLLNTYIPYGKIDSIAEGDHIAIRATIIDHPPPRNPYAFDYGAFLSRKRIFHQTAQLDTALVISKCPSPLFVFSKVRQRILKSLKSHLSNERHYSIAASIILGYRDDVSWETKEAFAKTGSMHVLAVSGLHVGIIWWFAGLIIQLIDNRHPRNKYIRAALYLIVIWCFVGLTGAPISAMRAAGLFTLITFADLLEGDRNLYHRLAIAAFGLLIWNTNNLFDVGFQLSFSAVLGIAAFIPIWDRVVYFPNQIVSYFWSGIGVTIGATLGTMPLTMYYFNYLPWTGLISGVFVVLLATMILMIGLVYLISFWIAVFLPALSIALVGIGHLMDWVIMTLTWIVDFFYSLPFGLISGISIGGTIVFLMYLILISTRLLFDYSSKNIFWVICGSLLLSSVFYCIDEYHTQQNDHIVFYHDYQSNAIEIFEKHKSILIADEPMSEYSSAFINTPLRNEWGITTHSFVQRSHADTVLNANFINEHAIFNGNVKVLIVDGKSNIDLSNDHYWDFIYLINNPELSISDIVDNLSFGRVVFGASNWRWRISKWLEECDTLQVDFHNIAEQNALIIETS